MVRVQQPHECSNADWRIPGQNYDCRRACRCSSDTGRFHIIELSATGTERKSWQQPRRRLFRPARLRHVGAHRPRAAASASLEPRYFAAGTAGRGVRHPRLFAPLKRWVSRVARVLDDYPHEQRTAGMTSWRRRLWMFSMLDCGAGDARSSSRFGRPSSYPVLLRANDARFAGLASDLE